MSRQKLARSLGFGSFGELVNAAKESTKLAAQVRELKTQLRPIERMQAELVAARAAFDAERTAARSALEHQWEILDHEWARLATAARGAIDAHHEATGRSIRLHAQQEQACLTPVPINKSPVQP